MTMTVRPTNEKNQNTVTPAAQNLAALISYLKARSAVLFATILGVLTASVMVTAATTWTPTVSAAEQSPYPCRFATPTEWEHAFNSITTPESKSPGVVATDGYIGTELPDGNTLFLFGDTYVGTTTERSGKEAIESQNFHRNTAVIYHPDAPTKTGCFTQIFGADNSGVFDNPEDPTGENEWWWPSSIIRQPGTTKTYVTAAKLRKTGTSAWDATGTGSAIFPITYKPESRTPITAGTPIPITANNSGKGTNILWGAATWTDPNGNVFVYGTKQVDEPFVFGRSVYVSRIKAGTDITDTGGWEYLTYDGWKTGEQPDAALKPVRDARQGGASTTFGVVTSEHGTPVIITKKNEFLGTDIVAWEGPASSDGDFGAERILAATPEANKKNLTYMPLPHPYLPAPAGKMWITINRNTADLKILTNDVTKYQAQWRLVPRP